MVLVTHNFRLQRGRWMGPNFLLALLETPAVRALDAEFTVVSRGPRRATEQHDRLRLHQVASDSIHTEPLDRYGALWNAGRRQPRWRALRERLGDSRAVGAEVRRRLAVLDGADVAHWTEPYIPLGALARRRGCHLLTMFNYAGSGRLPGPAWRLGLLGFDRVVATTAALAARLRRAGLPEQRVLHVPVGVDLDRFRPLPPPERERLRQRLGIEPPDRVVLWLGPIIPPAEVEDARAVVRAAVEVSAAVPEALFVCAFKYGVPPDLWSDHPRVRLLAREGEIVDLLQAADVLLLPFGAGGEWYTLPLSVAEALACGLPVVTVARGGLDEVVVEGVSGVLLEHPRRLTAQVAGLLRDDPRREQLARGARAIAEQQLDIRAVAERYVALWRGEP